MMVSVHLMPEQGKCHDTKGKVRAVSALRGRIAQETVIHYALYISTYDGERSPHPRTLLNTKLNWLQHCSGRRGKDRNSSTRT
jgi:hypothetical protein